MNKIEPKTLKGFPDYAPEEQLARQKMFATIQNTFERYGFLPLSTPALEYKEILMNKYGDEEKLVYSFQDNGGREVAMRYDLTVPLARFVAQNQNNLTYPFKRYQIAPVWRAENTQKGRLREFYQCDIDTVGSSSPLADAEVIACICKTLEALGIIDYQVRINDRRLFNVFGGNSSEATEIIRAIDKFKKIGSDGVREILKEKNVSADLIAKVNSYLELASVEDGKSVEKIASELGGDVAEVWQSLRNLLDSLKGLGVEWVKLKVDPTIARGLDYYTSTVFEIVLPAQPEFGSIGGGGRYDNLLDTFSEKSLPAVGGSIGIDRLFEALGVEGKLSVTGGVTALVVNQDETLQGDYLNLVTSLRVAGVSSELYYETAKLDKQFKYAESKGIEFAIIVGQEEQQKNIVQLKNIQTREQKPIEQNNLADYLLGNAQE